MRIAVTGAGGRLGRAIVRALEDAPFTGPAGPVAWHRAEFDLDDPSGIGPRLDASGVELVIHAAAWTDVDACAREPELALRRNGAATGVLAAATTARGIDLLVISTNEVFSGGLAAVGRPFGPGDPPAPANPYGASKLAGERAATAAYAGAAAASGPALGIARTAWLFGPGAPDFPTKIAAAARRAIDAGEPLKVVRDELGTPTYVADVADAIVELIGDGAVAGIHHLVNGGVASRAEWARDVLARLDLRPDVVEVPQAEFQRPSTPPLWGVLAQTPLPSGEPIRPWREAMADYAPVLRRSVTMTP